MVETVKKNELLDAARKAALSAYAPYSKFRVGAAVLANGNIYSGSNVENASYGLTMCAERIALFQAIHDQSREIEALALACVDAGYGSSGGEFMPCGSCLQVLTEFTLTNTPIYVDGAGDFTLSELLPYPFSISS